MTLGRVAALLLTVTDNKPQMAFESHFPHPYMGTRDRANAVDFVECNEGMCLSSVCT